METPDNAQTPERHIRALIRLFLASGAIIECRMTDPNLGFTPEGKLCTLSALQSEPTLPFLDFNAVQAVTVG